MLREERKRRKRKRRKQILLALLVLTGISSISIIESTAHEKKTVSHFNDLPTVETVKDNGIGNINLFGKDEQKSETLDNEGTHVVSDEKEEVVKPTETTKDGVNVAGNKDKRQDKGIQVNSNKKETNIENNKSKNEDKKTEEEKEPTAEKFDKNEKDNFADAVFIGDSRTEGLQINTGLTTAKFLAVKGLKVDTALKDSVIKLKGGSKGTIIDGLKEGTYNRVYLMFGMNELGWPYLDVFTSRYEKLISEILEVQPNATIYVQSILPVTKEKSDKDSIYNNKKINKFNKAIKKMADKNGYIYLDVASAVMDSNSALPSNASVDGVHLNKEYSQKWLNYLREVK